MALGVLRCSALVTFTLTISKHTKVLLAYQLCECKPTEGYTGWISLPHLPLTVSTFLRTGGGGGSIGEEERGGKTFRVVGTIHWGYSGNSCFNILPAFLHKEDTSNYGEGSNLTDLIVVTRLGIRINRKYFPSIIYMLGTLHVLTHLMRQIWSLSHLTDEETKAQTREVKWLAQSCTASKWRK